MNAETKAHLLSVGRVELVGEVPWERSSTAGPGAGERSVFFGSADKLVRLNVVPSSPLRMEVEGGRAVIVEDGRELVRGVLVRPLAHCPEQAYITVSERCIFDCKFCAVPRLMGRVKTLAEVQEIVEQASSRGGLKAISLTSGVEVSPEHEARRVAEMVRALLPCQVPIGVSVTPARGSSHLLKQAGAVEVKYNLETVDPELFREVCPGQSMEQIKEGLVDGVAHFGRNRVFSNVIVGLGETDKVLCQGIAELAEMGVLPGLRPVYPHPLRQDELEMKRPSMERMLRLARFTRRELDKNELRGDRALTMCYRCTGCDLTPHRDL
ncbi:MAG: radical SAM protein [Methanosarcinales archaeon]|nr:radical SAM protein [Methanosarcinales archaeon]